MQAVLRTETALSTVLASRWRKAAAKLEQLAAEFPEAKYDWRPCAETKTCGEVLRHVAFWNRYAADILAGKPADGSGNELPAAEFPTRAKVLEALQQSNENAVAAVESAAGDAAAAETALSFLQHMAEHYGQLAVYARLLDMVPPASRG